MKVGDRVKVTNSLSLNYGYIGTIVEVGIFGGFYRIKFPHRSYPWMYTELELELVEKEDDQ